MKILTVGSAVYLGEIEKTKTGIIIRNAVCLGNGVNVEKRHLVSYLKAKNAAKLDEEIELDGQITYSQRKLSEDLQLEFDILTKQLDQAKKQALPELENGKFDQLIAGR